MATKLTTNAMGRPMTYDRQGDDLTLGVKCPFCGEVQNIQVTSQQFFDWQHGKLVQDAFPQLSASQREVLLTGICDDCFPKD